MENSDAHLLHVFIIYAGDMVARVVAVFDFLAVGVDDVLHAPEVVRAVLRCRRLRGIVAVEVRV